MRIIFINSIYPNPIEPAKGNFVLKNLLHYPAEIDVEVIAPVPLFLAFWRKKKQTLPFVRKEDLGQRHIRVWHPRFLLFPRNLLRPLVPFFEYLSVFALLCYLNKIKKIDALHANFCLPDGVATRRLAKRLNLPYIITEHQAVLADYLQNKRLKNLMLPAYLDAEKVIAVSKHTAGILEKAGVPNQKLQVIPNGIDTSLFVPTQRKGPIKKLIYIGYLVEHKGVHLLIQALFMLPEYDLQLSIVGDGVFRKQLESLSDEYGLKDRISFLGEKKAAEVAQLLGEHDALVHPSFIESFGITVVEALATGLPVVATINGGSEHILNEDTGILVPARDAQALANGIKALVSRTWDSNYIRSYAEKHYDIRSVVKDTISLYPKAAKSICHLSSVHIRSDVRVFYKQCVGLAKAGFEVHLVLADDLPPEKKMGVKIHSVGKCKSRPFRMLFSPLKLLLKALSLKADVYQFHDPELIPMAFLLKALSKKPLIYDVHESYPEMFLHKEYLKPWQGKLFSRLIKALEAFANRRFDATIAATEHIASQFDKKALILHNYPLISEWEKVPENPQRYQSRAICYLGSITRERGIGQILKALPDVDCTFHLAGSYEPAGFRDELALMPGFHKVKEYGYLNRSQATDLLSSCALGVVFFDRSPNHLYSLSTKMFEYMAAGLPILVSDLPANKELIDRAECGLYLNPEKPENIAHALNELLAQPDKLAAMGQRGKAMILNELSWEAEETAYIALMRLTMGENHENTLS